jgi:hypothetical protein
MFKNSHFNRDIRKWNTSCVKNMSQMFRHSSFNHDISAWDISKVTDKREMFEGALFVKDLSRWGLKWNQLKELFGGTLPRYLEARKSIEDKNQLIESFVGARITPNRKRKVI